MKIKIGNLLIHKKAILTIAFCLFTNGLIIGAIIATPEDDTVKTISLLVVFLVLPYIMLGKTIKENITRLQ